jgi:hypothetical protein
MGGLHGAPAFVCTPTPHQHASCDYRPLRMASYVVALESWLRESSVLKLGDLGAERSYVEVEHYL